MLFVSHAGFHCPLFSRATNLQYQRILKGISIVSGDEADIMDYCDSLTPPLALLPCRKSNLFHFDVTPYELSILKKVEEWENGELVQKREPLLSLQYGWIFTDSVFVSRRRYLYFISTNGRNYHNRVFNIHDENNDPDHGLLRIDLLQLSELPKFELRIYKPQHYLRKPVHCAFEDEYANIWSLDRKSGAIYFGRQELRINDKPMENYFLLKGFGEMPAIWIGSSNSYSKCSLLGWRGNKPEEVAFIRENIEVNNALVFPHPAITRGYYFLVTAPFHLIVYALVRRNIYRLLVADSKLIKKFTGANGQILKVSYLFGAKRIMLGIDKSRRKDNSTSLKPTAHVYLQLKIK